jgi:molybdopterin/thiamine biosynthesis adenylyltransferase
MASRDPQDVQEHLKNRVNGNKPSSEELVLNPATGEFEVKRTWEKNPDDLTAGGIADDGFFLETNPSNSPSVYMHEEQVQGIFQSLSPSQTHLVQSTAFAFDNDDLFHIYTSPPNTQLSGSPCASAIQILPNMPKGNEGFTIAKQVNNTLFGSNHSAKQTVIVLLALEDNQLQHRVFLTSEKDQFFEGIVKLIPERAELYSRSKGLLETSVLEKSKVGIVGLGSGGATIAVEIAKAGVGSFELIDFDRLELSNISRHICGIGDLGRYKTMAVRDLLYGKNPYVKVHTAEYDINQHLEEITPLLKDCDLIIAATDNDRSRFNLNSLALQYKIPTIFGRALTRACGGDVLRVRPYEGPCLGCVFTQKFLATRQEEVSQFRQAREDNPAYVSDKEVNATIQVGLSSDILPVSNMIVKLALLELSRGKPSGITSLEEDLIADFYIWANRREKTYANWPKMEYGSKTPAILRWYGAKWERNPNCPVCGEQNIESLDGDNIFG